MIREKRIYKVICIPHFSEKSSVIIEKYNTIALKVIANATKIEIKYAVQKIFGVEVKGVNTLIVKGKIKNHKNYIGRRRNWKKAYVSLKKGFNVDFISDIK